MNKDKKKLVDFHENLAERGRDERDERKKKGRKKREDDDAGIKKRKEDREERWTVVNFHGD